MERAIALLATPSVWEMTHGSEPTLLLRATPAGEEAYYTLGRDPREFPEWPPSPYWPAQ